MSVNIISGALQTPPSKKQEDFGSEQPLSKSPPLFDPSVHPGKEPIEAKDLTGKLSQNPPTEKTRFLQSQVLPIAQPMKTTKFDEKTCELLLQHQLVDSHEELLLLDHVVSTGLIAPAAIPVLEKFSVRARDVIAEFISSKNEQGLNILYKAIFEIACSEPEKRRYFLPHFEDLLDHTNYSPVRRIISRCSLDVRLLQYGFNTLVEFLATTRVHDRSMNLRILERLTCLTNHPEFPIKLRCDLLSYVSHYAQNPCQKFALLMQNASLQYPHPESLQRVIDNLHFFLNTSRLSTDEQLEILLNTQLQEKLLKLNTEGEPVRQIVAALLECASARHASLEVNHAAVRLLKLWIVNEHVLFMPRQKDTFEKLISLAKAHSSEEIRSAILSELYHGFENYIPSQSCYTTFFNAFQALLNDDHLDVPLRLTLAAAMPLGNLPLQAAPATMLFHMMLEKIKHPDHPYPLTKMYVQKMAQISSNCHCVFYIGICDATDIRHIPLISQNPELVKIAKNYRKSKSS